MGCAQRSSACWGHRVASLFLFDPRRGCCCCCVCATQTCYVMLTQMGGADLLTPLDTFALLVAAFAHDLEHPGMVHCMLCLLCQGLQRSRLFSFLCVQD